MTTVRSAWRSALVATLGWVPAATLLVHRSVGWDGLPAMMPTHWPLLGEPDGFSSREGFWWLALGTCVGAAVVASVAAVQERRSQRWTRAGCVAGLGVAGASAGTWWAAVGASTLTTSDPFGLWPFIGVAGLLWAAPCRWLLPGHRVATSLNPNAAGLELGPNERAAWSQVVSAPWMTFVTVSGTAVAVLAAVVGRAEWSAALVLAAITLVFARIEVSVDRRGLRVVSGLLRLPIRRIPLQQVARADAENIRPLAWGGWGYRIMPGRSALVLRSGPAVVLTLDDGRRFAATVDDPDGAAALLNALRAPV